MPQRGRRTDRSAADFFPTMPKPTLPALRRAALGCRGCDLYRLGTQTVFGEGSPRARVMLVGEKPGHEEDLAGRPFVGPAGRLLRAALDEAGIAAGEAYLTNVVKHFKWEPRGGRRFHKSPNRSEVTACIPWLQMELELVRPAVLVCLGATAAKALLGAGVRVSRQRGEWIESDLAPYVTATVHPSAILRSRDRERRHRERALFIEDLRRVAEVLAREPRRRAA